MICYVAYDVVDGSVDAYDAMLAAASVAAYDMAICYAPCRDAVAGAADADSAIDARCCHVSQRDARCVVARDGALCY